MSSAFRSSLAIVFLALAAFGASGQSAGNQQAGSWEQIKAYSHEKKQDAVTHGKKLMREIDKKIAEAGAAAKKSRADLKTANEANMKDLQARKKAAQAKLAEMEKAGASAWEATKTGFADAYRDLHHAVEKAHAGATAKN